MVAPFRSLLRIYNLSQADTDFPVERSSAAHKETELTIRWIDPEVGVMIPNPAVNTLGHVLLVNRWVVQHEKRKSVGVTADWWKGVGLVRIAFRPAGGHGADALL